MKRPRRTTDRRAMSEPEKRTRVLLLQRAAYRRRTNEKRAEALAKAFLLWLEEHE